MTSQTQALERDRILAERRRRMAECWADDQPSELVVRAAFQRFERKQQQPSDERKRSLRDVWRFGFAGAALGFACMALASWQSTRGGGSANEVRVSAPSTHVGAPSPAANAAPRLEQATPSPAQQQAARTAFVERAGARIAIFEGMRVELGAGQSATFVLGETSHEVHGPRVVEMHWSEQVAGWEMTFKPKAVAAEVISAEPIAPSPVPDPAAQIPVSHPAQQPAAVVNLWKHAATALEKRDYAAADAAFAGLAEDANPETRDAALLARAQVWLAQGRPSVARPVLERLRNNSASPVVRQRAAQLLQNQN